MIDNRIIVGYNNLIKSKKNSPLMFCIKFILNLMADEGWFYICFAFVLFLLELTQYTLQLKKKFQWEGVEQ